VAPAATAAQVRRAAPPAPDYDDVPDDDDRERDN
jgi:hypothetical protein